jgi:hypothetical protein
LVATSLIGKPYSAKIAVCMQQLTDLRSKCMAKISNCGGKTGSVTPSTALLNQKLDTFQTPPMLTLSEIELLRKSKREMAARFKELSNG